MLCSHFLLVVLNAGWWSKLQTEAQHLCLHNGHESLTAHNFIITATVQWSINQLCTHKEGQATLQVQCSYETHSIAVQAVSVLLL